MWLRDEQDLLPVAQLGYDLKGLWYLATAIAFEHIAYTLVHLLHLGVNLLDLQRALVGDLGVYVGLLLLDLLHDHLGEVQRALALLRRLLEALEGGHIVVVHVQVGHEVVLVDFLILLGIAVVLGKEISDVELKLV